MVQLMLDDVVVAVEQACLADADTALRSCGAVPKPRVHLFIDDLDQPYLGYVGTRPYYPGEDAATAITTLGAAAAAAMATRVLLVWEAADLRRSLTGTLDHSTGLVCVTASVVEDRHTLNWYPFTLDLHVPPLGGGGEAVLDLQWGTPTRTRDVELPPVMGDLLHEWRSTQPDTVQVFTRLEQDGYAVTLFPR